LEGLLSSFKEPSNNQKKKEKKLWGKAAYGEKNQWQSDILGQKLW